MSVLNFNPVTPKVSEISSILDDVTDPEIPVLTLKDLGVIRDIQVDEDDATSGRVTVVITPTYSGCPAMVTMEIDIRDRLLRAGFEEVHVETVLSPAWTTDWISEDGRKKLRDYGIAPPVSGSGKATLFAGEQTVACPQCGSEDTKRISEFGSTACKALYRCSACLEPFDYFKCI